MWNYMNVLQNDKTCLLHDSSTFYEVPVLLEKKKLITRAILFTHSGLDCNIGRKKGNSHYVYPYRYTHIMHSYIHP